MAGPVRLNETITFGKAGKIKEMDPFGFDLNEQTLSWTQEEAAGFSVMLGSVPPDAILRLRVAATPFTQAGHIDRQQLFVFINGLYVGFRILAAYEEIEFVVPRNVLSPRGLRVEFAIPTASSPKSLGISQDLRKLGFAIAGVSFGLHK